MNDSMTIRALSEPVHSGLGIASFVIAVLIGLSTFLIFVYAGVKETTLPGGVAENHTIALMIGLSMMLTWVLLFVGAVLGLVALFQKNRKKVFAVIGLTFNLGMLALSALVILLGVLSS